MCQSTGYIATTETGKFPQGYKNHGEAPGSYIAKAGAKYTLATHCTVDSKCPTCARRAPMVSGKTRNAKNTTL